MAGIDFAARCMSRSGFGERLKRERELRGVSRDEVCAATRIASRYLEALENERWEALPGGVFNRGFVRAVARFLGLGEDDMLAEYDAAMNEQKPEGALPATAVAQAPTKPAPTKKNGRPLLWFASLCAILALLASGWLGWTRRDKLAHQRKIQPPSEKATAIAQAPHSSTAPEPAVSAERATTQSENAVENQPALQLKIEAGKETSVSVSADGNKIFEGDMIAGQSRTFTAQAAIDISAKDAGALLLELNGQTLAPLGPPGQPGNATLTRDDLKTTGGGAD